MAQKNIEFAKNSKIDYSNQALDYLEIIEDIDMENFEAWMKENFIVGGGQVMQFMIQRIRNDKPKNTINHLIHGRK